MKTLTAALLAGVALLTACAPSSGDVRACRAALDARDRKTAVQRAKERLDGIPRVPPVCAGIYPAGE